MGRSHKLHCIHDDQKKHFMQMILIYFYISQSCHMLPSLESNALMGGRMDIEPMLISADRRWPADVDVWQVKMPDESIPRASICDYLDETERRRVDRYRLPEDRIRFAVTRSALRELLSRYIACAPGAIHFITGSYGRPALDGYAGLSFNVSHSGAHALIAISSVRAVGVDIERVDIAVDWKALLDLVCSDEERQQIGRGPIELRPQNFFRCWTAKEAILKTLGLGIAEHLRAITVNSFAEGIQQPDLDSSLVSSGASVVNFHWLADFPGYVGCIAFT